MAVNKDLISGVVKGAAGAVVGGTAVYVGGPVILGAIGFKSGGIAAYSLAAKIMSAAAVANGGGVASMPAWVALAQSAGATGTVAFTSIFGGAVAGVVSVAGWAAAKLR